MKLEFLKIGIIRRVRLRIKLSDDVVVEQDLYEENRIVDCVFSPQFIEAQLKHLSFRALLVINLLDVLQNDVIKLVSQYSKFSWCSGSVVINEGRQFLIVSNTDRNWFRDFRKNLNDMLCMYEF